MNQEIPSKDEGMEMPLISEDQISKELMEFEELVENECDSLHLLYKKTESFRCLQQVQLSSSAVMRNKDFRFPPLHDPGINEAFNYVEPEPVYDDIGVEKYVMICKELKIVPISRIVKSLPGDTINLKYYGLTTKQIQALTETLMINTHIKKLILQDNWLKVADTVMLSTMLEENSSIRILNLRECRIGQEGAEILNEALSSSQFLTELDLSFNSLGDKGLTDLQTGLCEAPNLRVLNISHNGLTEESADTLEKILLENKFIQELDLSWNSFCTAPGNKKLFNAMKENDILRVLNIAWNGISMKLAVSPLTNYLKVTENLEHLDISSNRLEGPSLKSVRLGIFQNRSLKSVKIGNNLYSPDDAYFLASVLPLKQQDPLTHLDMENMVFDKKVLPLLVRIKSSGKTIKYGSILGNYTIKGPDINKLIFQRCRYLLEKPKKKKLKKDFGHFVLSLPDESITKAQFATLLKKKKIKRLDQDLLKELYNRFTTRNQNIDCVEMKRVYMKYYPDTVLPPPPVKKKKGKKGKKGKGKEDEEVKVPEQQETSTEKQSEEHTAENENKCAVPTETIITDENIPVEVLQQPIENENTDENIN
ncbi:leucine-rich repeat-containing protein 74A-like [Anoplophora glabripennis]|uniref:leucine-rich repeat-containing protein 74A-like n=1 Tax=Anoplophora glabripennis TaxID=217634 RepID=UPI000C7871A7|nr:leucine-rich repeat-containing protein 74A-like [Anoplophora glabripennis]